VKDVRLAREAGLNTPLVQRLFASFEKAQNEGLGDEDVLVISKRIQ